jgi:hypothetical protein
MAHYAFIDENNLVTEVIVGIDETEKIEGLDPQTWYENFKNQKCLRTSYNGKIRGVFAGIGFSYNEQEDIFVTPQPYPSWVRDGSFWKTPVDYPQDGMKYSWNEEEGKWDVIS